MALREPNVFERSDGRVEVQLDPTVDSTAAKAMLGSPSWVTKVTKKPAREGVNAYLVTVSENRPASFLARIKTQAKKLTPTTRVESVPATEPSPESSQPGVSDQATVETVVITKPTPRSQLTAIALERFPKGNGEVVFVNVIDG
jgi:hypothetical protein